VRLLAQRRPRRLGRAPGAVPGVHLDGIGPVSNGEWLFGPGQMAPPFALVRDRIQESTGRYPRASSANAATCLLLHSSLRPSSRASSAAPRGAASAAATAFN